MRFSNLHTHTTYSDGKNTVRENIEAAIEKNMLSLGFSDHSFTPCDQSYCMKLENYGRYRAEISELKREYEGRLPIFTGLEKDYYSEINNEDFDYVIASVHYIIKDGKTHPIDHSPELQTCCINESFFGSALDMAKRYFELVVENARLSRPDVIGHFDVINKFSLMPEDSEAYVKIASEALVETSKYCKRFEINTGGISRGWRKTPYPNRNLLELLLKNGCEVVINSDSHKAENLDFFFEESAHILREVGFESYSCLMPCGFVKMPL
ncbi:MAG: histidinol-phosphatase [Clostridia bacterium]|nr:histidinol-phosphatase [Clostridia bacterium]